MVVLVVGRSMHGPPYLKTLLAQGAVPVLFGEATRNWYDRKIQPRGAEAWGLVELL